MSKTYDQCPRFYRNMEEFQTRVYPWLLECFGKMAAGDKEKRIHRFTEEAIELAQSAGATKEEILILVDYVFDRPQGEIKQEVGGVMITLAAFCLAHDINMHECADTELDGVWGKIDKIRKKQLGKPFASPLPGPTEGE